MIFISCDSFRDGCDCSICQSKRRAYRAGKQARRKGYSRHRNRGGLYEYDWLKGWEENGSPRVKRREAELLREAELRNLKHEKVRLTKERNRVIRQIATLSQ